MTIDTSGEWWHGTEPKDVAAYLRAFSADSYPVSQVNLLSCSCGAQARHLWADETEGVAKVACPECKAEEYLRDSADFWGEAQPEAWSCLECGSEVCDVGVGLSFYRMSQDVRWVYVGVRCAACGLLGCFAAWAER